jgi:uncharacterized BrkB/YihY/UPF0761 family membrane protein
MITENELPEDEIVIGQTLTRRTLIKLGWIILLLFPVIFTVSLQIVIFGFGMFMSAGFGGIILDITIISYLWFLSVPIVGWAWLMIVIGICIYRRTHNDFALYTHFQNKRKAKSKVRGAAT